MRNWIRKLQEKPYHARVRILWTVIGASVVILFIVFGYSLRLQLARSRAQESTRPSIFGVLGQGVREFARQLPEVIRDPRRPLNLFAPRYISIIDQDFSEGELVVRFTVDNSTDRILVIGGAQTAIELVHGDITYEPFDLLDDHGDVFPAKILSRTKVTGILTFSGVPEGESAKLAFRNLYFDDTPSYIWTEEFDVKLAPSEKRDILPRY
jgi:hypothetical protein